MAERPWLVQSRLCWCIAKDQSQEPDPSASVETLCDHFVVMPWGIRRGRPGCADCVVAEKVRTRVAAIRKNLNQSEAK